MRYTENYNLKKPEELDPVDIQDLNYNADVIDSKLKEVEDWEAAHLQASNPHSITPALIGAETPTGAQAKVDAHEQKAAPHSGHETPAGAEQKANTAAGAALQAANDYTDQKVGETKGLIGTLSQLVTTAKTNIVAAVNEIFGKVEDVEDDLASHKADNMPHQFINHKENKTYKFGFQLSAEGNPQIIFEEVV